MPAPSPPPYYVASVVPQRLCSGEPARRGTTRKIVPGTRSGGRAFRGGVVGQDPTLKGDPQP